MLDGRTQALALQQALGDPECDEEEIRERADNLTGTVLRVSRMMSEPDWGVGMLEDIAEIIGADPNPRREPRWERH